MRHDFVQTTNALLDELDAESLDQAMTSAARQGLALPDGTGISLDGADVIFEDMSYLGQTHNVAVPLDLPTHCGQTHALMARSTHCASPVIAQTVSVG